MAKKVSTYGILVCLALIFAYVERFFILPISVPGIKLGFANIVTLLALYLVPWQGALLISVGRVLLSTLLFSSPGSLLFSLGGCLLSFFVMLGAKRSGLFSVTGLFHNIGQIAVAACAIQNVYLLGYLPILMVAGSICGFITGKISFYVLRQLRHSHILPPEEKN